MGRNHFLGLPWHAMKEVRYKKSDLSQQAERNHWLRCRNIGDVMASETKIPLLRGDIVLLGLSTTLALSKLGE